MSEAEGLQGRVTIRKLDTRGRELWRYEGEVLSTTRASVQLEAWYDRADQDFHGMQLRHGDRYLETHYSDRWYNVFEIYDLETKQLKGWYLNITRPATFRDGQISAVDLALDLLVFPTGRWLVLDEEEFEALDLSAADRRHALDTLHYLQEMIRERQGPFESIA